MNMRTFSRKYKRQGPLAISQTIINRERAYVDEFIDNTLNEFKQAIMNDRHNTPFQVPVRLTPEEEKEKIRKLKEQQKKISPTKERMARLQLEERIFPKRIDPSQIKKYNREIAQSLTMDEAGTLYAIMVDGNGIKELSDVEKINPKLRNHILKIILDASTMDKLIRAVWQAEPEISVMSGITQRQAIAVVIRNLFF